MVAVTRRFISIVEQYDLEKARIESPAPPTLQEAKRAKVEELKLAAEAEAYAYIAEYPEFETKTWPSQEDEARAYAEDASALTPTISDIMVGRNISEPYKAAFVEKILEKADTFRAPSSRIAGKRQRLVQMVEGSQSVSSVQEIKW